MRPPPLSIDQYKQGIISGDTAVLGRAITLVESQLAEDRALASDLLQSLLSKTGGSIRIAVSGVPGVGKSTFVEAFGKHLTGMKRKVAVLAIDPSSTRTQGSILGDKTRMEELSKDPLAYVRPSPTTGHLGGVGSRTRESILLCEAAGYDIVLVETVGTGQSETAARGMVDFFLLLMLAGAGDELQGIKKGIIEMADGIFINKADGDNVVRAKQAQADLQHALHFLAPAESGWQTRVATCSAIERTGIAEVWKTIDSFIRFHDENGVRMNIRKHQNRLWMEESLNDMLLVAQRNSSAFSRRRQELDAQVEEGAMYPPTAAGLLWKTLLSDQQ